MTAAAYQPCVAWGLGVPDCPGLAEANLTPTQTTTIRDFVQGYLYVETGKRFTGLCPGVLAPPPGYRSDCNLSLIYHLQNGSSDSNVIDVYDFLGQHIENIQVTAVKVAGVPLTVGVDYRFDNGRYLIPLNGGALSPRPRQDLHAVMGTANTWSIEFTAGYPVPAMGLMAAADLQCELYRRALNMACDVPDNAVIVTRGDMTVKLMPGYRGIPSVAAFLDAFPKRRRTRPRVYDLRRVASTTASRQPT